MLGIFFVMVCLQDDHLQFPLSPMYMPFLHLERKLGQHVTALTARVHQKQCCLDSQPRLYDTLQLLPGSLRRLALEEASFHESKNLTVLKPLGYEEIQGSHVEREMPSQPPAVPSPQHRNEESILDILLSQFFRWPSPSYKHVRNSKWGPPSQAFSTHRTTGDHE